MYLWLIDHTSWYLESRSVSFTFWFYEVTNSFIFILGGQYFEVSSYGQLIFFVPQEGSNFFLIPRIRLFFFVWVEARIFVWTNIRARINFSNPPPPPPTPPGSQISRSLYWLSKKECMRHLVCPASLSVTLQTDRYHHHVPSGPVYIGYWVSPSPWENPPGGLGGGWYRKGWVLPSPISGQSVELF